MSNSKFQNALNRVPQAVPPVWMMRQAGRYHKHYQALKEKHDFMTLCKEPELAAQVALGPIEDFDFDVSILFSDLLFPLEALGMNLKYAPGPQFDKNLELSDLSNLKSHDEAIAFMKFQAEAVKITREMLPDSKSLIGFVGGPWTLFTYAVAGGHDGNLILPKTQPQFFESFCERMIPLLVDNITLQKEAGCEVVMVFDTAAGELSPAYYNQYIVPQLDKLAKAHPGILGYYSKYTHEKHLAPNVFSNQNWAGFGVDHRWSLPDVLQKSQHGFRQGNFDQSLLFMEPDDFKKQLRDFLQSFKQLSPEERAGWVCGLGHGVLPKTPEENVRSFVNIVREEMA